MRTIHIFDTVAVVISRIVGCNCTLLQRLSAKRTLMNPNTRYGNARREVAFALMDVGAVLTSESIHPRIVVRRGAQGMERGFKLKHHEKNPNAPLSPLFFNLRIPSNPEPGPLTPAIVDLAARCMRHVQLEKKLEPDAMVGVPRAGDPFAQALARLAGTPCIALNKHEYGTTRCIAGLKGHVPGSIRKVLPIDDLVTKAYSKREAILNLREASFEVTDVVVLIDHEQGGREELAKLGCTLYSVFTATELLDEYVKVGKLNPGIRDAYRAIPV